MPFKKGNTLGKLNKGKKYGPFTEERKKKISSILSGRKRPAFSDETKLRMSISKRGEKHPKWRGGITKRSMVIRNSYAYRKWRTEVLKRDGFACQICSSVGGELHSHHIKHFAVNLKERFEVDNGITLCKRCHYDLHKMINHKK